jgi:transcriptional regulator with XRE-family HTH domain
MDAHTVLKKAKRLARTSGLTYQEIGVRMGYPPESARQSVGQFLNSRNPSVAMLIRFAEALGADIRSLF